MKALICAVYIVSEIRNVATDSTYDEMSPTEQPRRYDLPLRIHINTKGYYKGIIRIFVMDLQINISLNKLKYLSMILRALLEDSR